MADADAIATNGAADDRRVDTRVARDVDNVIGICDAHLDNRAELFGKELGQRIGRLCEIDIEPASRCESHLGDCRKNSAVADVVIGDELVRRVQLLNERKEARELLRRIDIGRFVAELPMHLCER